MKFNENNLDILDNYDEDETTLRNEGEENFKYYKFLEEYLSKFSKIYKALSKARKKQNNHLTNISQQTFVMRQLSKIYEFKFFFLIILYILFVYYVYIYWHAIPNLESTNPGMDLRFFDSENYSNHNYIGSMIEIIVHNFITLIIMICLIGVVFKEPGFLDDNYVDLHSPTFFLRKFISYFCGNINGRMQFNDRKSQYEEMNLIRTKYELFKDRIQKFKYLFSFDEAEESNSKFIDNKNKNDNVSETNDNNHNAIKSNKSNENLFQVVLNFESEYIQECTMNNNYSIFFNKFSLEYGCGYCFVAKPRRAHHCRICKTCIKRMDHHCYILCSCVGYNNYKQFFLLLFYSSLMHIFVVKNSINSLSFYFYEYRSSYYLGFYLFYLILTICLGIVLIIFFLYHLYLVLNNTTTLEDIEKSMSKSPYYSISYYYNLKAFLGKNPLLWFIPIGTGYEEKYPLSNGYDFDINEEVYSNYIKILNVENCKKQEEKNAQYKENSENKLENMASNEDIEFNTNVSNEKLNKSIDFNNRSSKNNHIVIQENYYLNELDDQNSTRLNDNLTNEFNKDSREINDKNDRDLVNGLKK